MDCNPAYASNATSDVQCQTSITTTVAQATTPDTTMADMTDMTEDTTPDMTDMMMDVNVFADLQVAAETVGNNGNAKALSAGIVEAVGLDGCPPCSRSMSTWPGSPSTPDSPPDSIRTHLCKQPGSLTATR